MDFLDQIKQGANGPNKMPAGYFTQFPERMMERVRWEEELKAIAPLLADISRKPVYKLPDGYFEQFTVKPMTVAAKVVSMPSWRSMISYAAAAAVAGFLIMGAFMYTNKQSVQSLDLSALNTIDVPAELNKLPAEDLQQYLAANVVGGAGHELAVEIVEPTNDHIENLSDEELMNYLNEAGEKPELK